ncbi:hypothetical protein LSTR_LSTR009701 [Laodelphax striatellus]|uniref:Uncharacterized protein n=1 Tax=Laodelphax striatellus TaxID=195883 RepID=A0A482WV54_LAOST|nr:hypothetical protein LSTR_LSTR009701 [Laodelphax striatellus]
MTRVIVDGWVRSGRDMKSDVNTVLALLWPRIQTRSRGAARLGGSPPHSKRVERRVMWLSDCVHPCLLGAGSLCRSHASHIHGITSRHW